MWASLSRHECKCHTIQLPKLRMTNVIVDNLQAFTMALSENLWGPWGDASIIFEAPTLVPGAWCYAPTMHPQYDMTMKSLVFSYTQQPNIQQAARVVSRIRSLMLPLNVLLIIYYSTSLDPLTVLTLRLYGSIPRKAYGVDEEILHGSKQELSQQFNSLSLRG